jgi:hypothetical protein
MFFPSLQAVTNGTRFLNQGYSYVAIPRSFQYYRNFVRALAENALDLDKGVYSKIAIGSGQCPHWPTLQTQVEHFPRSEKCPRSCREPMQQMTCRLRAYPITSSAGATASPAPRDHAPSLDHQIVCSSNDLTVQCGLLGEWAVGKICVRLIRAPVG